MDLNGAFKDVGQLVLNFQANLTYYISAGYQEAEVRKDFIDKFFIALGWDVNHENQINPYQQEVKVEKGQKQGQNLSQRRADYAFYLNPDFKNVQFFVEAKKPAVGLKHPDHYFQIWRYGWNASTPIAILTDFEEFHIIDCRAQPDIDSVFSGHHKIFRFSDYQNKEKFAEIYFLFSREAVEQGSLERYANDLPQIRGKASHKSLFRGGYQAIDESFLHYIDSVRETLAKAFTGNDPNMDGGALTESVTRIIDRLVFIRFLEDKNIEHESHVSAWSSWRDFVEDCRKLDAKYNGIVFKRHFIDNQTFSLDQERLFLTICQDISSINSPYDFNYIPVHILGSIYERFLGKIVTITGTRVAIEEKEQVRKSGGVYYTPKYVVDQIVLRTVGELIKNKSPKEISLMRFADIACGSGSFLLGVYELLLDYHTKYYYTKLEGKTEIDGRSEDFGMTEYRDGVWELTLRARQSIMLNNIFGVDIDHQAVEVTQLSLFLKMLEDQTLTSTRLRQGALFSKVLPDLTKNIICGNSLVGTEILEGSLFSFDQERQINPMDYSTAFPDIMENSGFDAIVGNPPYDVLEKERLQDLSPHEVLTEYVKYSPELQGALGGKLNLFRFFIVKALQLLRPSGRLGYIVPLSIVGDTSNSKTREYLVSNTNNLIIEAFPQKDNVARRIFRDAKLSTCIILGSKSKSRSQDKKLTIRTFPGNNFQEPHKTNEIFLRDLKLIDPENLPIPLIDSVNWNLLTRIHNNEKCRNIADLTEDVVVRRGEINQTIYRKYITESPNQSKLIKGVQIGRYRFNTTLSQGKVEWFDELQLHKEKSAKPIKSLRRIATQRITGVDERLRLVATIIDPPAYFADSTNSLNLTSTSKYELEYVLALINSHLFQWRFKLTSTNNNVGTNEILAMPFRIIDFGNKKDRDAHDRICSTVRELFAAKAKLSDLKRDSDISYLKTKIFGFERRIEAEIYQLYNLTDEEIKLIERGLTKVVGN
ncbi:Eco57I restriction-modification methylase domain-containing protein [Flavitalea antarctica]